MIGQPARKINYTISLHWRMVGWRWPATMRISANPLICWHPAVAPTWVMDGKHGAGANPAMTGQLLRSGHPGTIRKIEVDTAHYKGNYPDKCSVQGAYVQGGTEQSMITQSMFWPMLLPEQSLTMDKIHTFADQIHALGTITHIRFNIIPDGGVSRLRLWGILDEGGSQ